MVCQRHRRPLLSCRIVAISGELHSRNNRAELGLFISSAYRGQGYGREALSLLTGYSRDHLGLRQLYVFIAQDNEVCLNLFESYGYRRVGIITSWIKRGTTYHDAVLLQMIL